MGVILHQQGFSRDYLAITNLRSIITYQNGEMSLKSNIHPLKLQAPLNVKAHSLVISPLKVLHYFMHTPVCPPIQVCKHLWNSSIHTCKNPESFL